MRWAGSEDLCLLPTPMDQGKWTSGCRMLLGPGAGSGFPEGAIPPCMVPDSAQLSLGDGQKGQLHIHARLSAGLHEGHSILLPDRDYSQGQSPAAPTPHPAHRRSLTLASVSPSSERITLPLLTSACQAQVGHSGEGSLDPSWPLSCPCWPIFCPRSRHCPPSAGGLWDCKRYDWNGARVPSPFRLSPPAPNPGSHSHLGKWVTLLRKGVVTQPQRDDSWS